jgi:hypothetical protein
MGPGSRSDENQDGVHGLVVVVRGMWAMGTCGSGRE